MRIAVTGGFGFLGWHTSCRLRALHGIEPVRIGRETLADPVQLDESLSGVDAVIHLAGVNRGTTDAEVEQGNVDVANQLGEAVVRLGRPLNVSYANSTQSMSDNPYGRGKKQAAEVLGAAVATSGGQFCDVVLPNIFGEHGRPGYNSFVATFAHLVATGGQPTVTEDREVPLLHVQDAAEAMISSVMTGASGRASPHGQVHAVSEVLDRLTAMHHLYSRGEIPPLTSAFEVDLFNTYRSHLFPALFPFAPQLHTDDRGTLFESVRSHGGTGQAYVSTTVPGATRGEHYHLRKFERFVVVKGEAKIELRRLFHDEVLTFELTGDRPAIVDMPTMWVHNITNIGDSDLVTMFWADQLLDPDNPDQYPERVRQLEESS